MERNAEGCGEPQLKVYEGVLRDKMDDLVRSDMLITINSDDPAYFQVRLPPYCEICMCSPRCLCECVSMRSRECVWYGGGGGSVAHGARNTRPDNCVCSTKQ